MLSAFKHIVNRIASKDLVYLLGFILLQFLVSVNGFAQCTLACNNSVQVALNSTGMTVVTPAIIMQGNGAGCTNLGVEVFDINGAPIGNMVDCSHVGQTLTAHLIDLNTGNYCASSITMIDAIAPVLSCPQHFILCNAPTSPDSIGYPLATDNCTVFTNADLSYTDNLVDLPCYSSQNGNVVTARIDRTWTVTDGSSNWASCVQEIYLLRSLLSDVVFPTHKDGLADPKLTCSLDDPNDLSITGQPTIGGRPIDNAGHCEIATFFSEQTFPTCGGSYRILRTWTAHDFCTNTSDDFIQIIDVDDMIDPVFSCPADITLNTSTNTCDANVLLPTVTATDECSGVIVDASWNFGSGLGPHPNVPVGTHLVTYTATDDCGNSSICTISVTVQDINPPTPICENNLSVSLLPTGTARIYASVFDEGTNDNCAIDRFEVSRNGLPFSGFVDFYCADINNPVLVHFRAFDIYGLYNDCWITVNVNDNYFPALTCPADITINCEDDYEDFNIVGQATASDACGLDTIYYVDNLSLNCGNGTIQREWKAEDISGNMSSCFQTITVVDNNNFTVNFPPDVTIDLCTNSTNPSNTGNPLITGDACRNVAVTHNDQIFTSPTYCYTIVRTWTVIDWCEYDPNSGNNNGYYQQGQVIDVTDNSLPVISCQGFVIALDTSANCSGAFVTVPLASAVDCDPNVIISNDSQYALSPNEDASGFYPPGIHVVNYVANDNCGNAANCSTTIEVKDGKAPTVVCTNGFSASISASGSITITPTMLISAAFDNCSNYNDLTFAVFPNTFTCADIGVQNVTVTATDLEGNVGNCNTFITIQDSGNYCSTGTATIAGNCSRENGSFIQNIEMNISGGQTGMIQTDANGLYDFPSLPTGSNYVITPHRDINHGMGVSTFDIVLIQQHILGIYELNSPYKLIAADVNNSGSVSTFDIVRIRQLILGVIGAFPSNKSWRFVDADFVFPNPNNPWQTSFPETHTCTNLTGNEIGVNFMAIKIGDVNYSASPTSLTSEDTQSRNLNESILINLESDSHEVGEEFVVSMKSSNFEELISMQFALNYETDKIEFVNIENDDHNLFSKDNIGLKNIDKGQLLFSWSKALGATLEEDKEMVRIKFLLKAKANLEEVFFLNDRTFENEVYTADYESTFVEITFIENEQEETPVQTQNIDENMVGQNYPNPMQASTFIPIELIGDASVEINFYTQDGKKIHDITKDLQAGMHTVQVNRMDLNTASGIVFYQVKINDEMSVTYKIILAD